MEIGDRIPNLEKNRIIVNKTSESKVMIDDLPTFIHFWSYGCQICKQTLSEINLFRERFEDKINIISVHMPRSEQELQVNLVKEQITLNQIKHITIVDNQYTVADAFQNKFVPAFYLFDKNGILIDFQAGELNIQNLDNKVKELLK